MVHNFKFLLPRMTPYMKVKFRVIVFEYKANNGKSEPKLSLPNDSMCNIKIPTYCFCPVHKSDNQELT